MLKVFAPANSAAGTILHLPPQPAPYKLIAAQFTLLPASTPQLPRLVIGQWINGAVDPMWLLHGGVIDTTTTVIQYGIGLPAFQTPPGFTDDNISGNIDPVTGNVVEVMAAVPPLCVQRSLPDVWLDPSLRISFSTDGGTFASSSVKWVFESYGE